MSTIAVGPALDIDGPLPVAPPHSLLLTEGVVLGRDATRVLNGVNVDGYPTGCASLWEPCSTGTFRLKSNESTILTPRFDSFVAYKEVVCSSLGMGDPFSFAQRVEKVMDAILSAAVEEAIAGGIEESANPFIGDGTVDVLSAAAVSPKTGLAYLENAIGRTCRQGMVLATPASVVAMGDSPFPSVPEKPIITRNGTPVVSADGIIGLDTPSLPATDPDGTEDWMLASGPIHVYLGPIEVRDIEETLDRGINEVTVIAERYVLAFWDTALQAAVKVDWSL